MAPKHEPQKHKCPSAPVQSGGRALESDCPASNPASRLLPVWPWAVNREGPHFPNLQGQPGLWGQALNAITSTVCKREPEGELTPTHSGGSHVKPKQRELEMWTLKCGAIQPRTQVTETARGNRLILPTAPGGTVALPTLGIGPSETDFRHGPPEPEKNTFLLL